MLCNDSLELELFERFSEGAKLIRMKDWTDIKLSDIWIPSELLPNRQATPKSNVEYCSIFHTLTKPQLSDSFSTYSDQSTNAVESNFNNEEWLDSLEEVTLCAEQKSYQCLTAEESNEKCNYREINESPLDSTVYLLKDLCIRDTENVNSLQGAEFSNRNYSDSKLTGDSVEDMEINRISDGKSVENLSDNSADLLEHLNINYTENMNSTLKSKTGATNNSEIKSNSPSKLINNSTSNDHSLNRRGKLSQVNSESSYYLSQTSDYDLFSKDSLECCPSLVKNSPCNEFWISSKSSTELSTSTRLLCTSSDTNSIIQAKDTPIPESHNVNSKFKTAISVIDEIKLECNDVVARLLTLPEKYSGGARSFENVFMNKDDLLEAKEEKLEETSVDDTGDVDHVNDTDLTSFPILQVYQRSKEDPAIESTSSIKKKTRKQKKMKQKNCKNVPLEDFFLSPIEAMHMEPEVDEFYESIIREKSGNYSDTQIPKTAFPPLPRKQEITFEPCNKFEKYERNHLNSKVSDCLREEELSLPEFDDFEKHPVQIKPVIDKNIIIIENIPLSVDEESLRNLLQIYGDIKSLNVKKSKKSLKAELSIDIEDPDWIIDGLDGTQPFGASSEMLKCYQMS